ncbi:MAG: DUF1080 domain-containing protein [Verrucomicrobiae bacterium]|nr:DUF1080 domain-containing protein [Verrucomicrobiae bacterium]
MQIINFLWERLILLASLAICTTAFSQNPDTNAAAEPRANEFKFFIWLRSLGVESNRVEQLKNELNVKELRQWLDEIEPPQTGADFSFNGKNLTGFYTWLEKFGTQNDPEGVFSVTSDGLLRISGQYRGFICTTRTFTNYHLIVEYKWGTKMWGNAAEKPKNSGIVIHANGADKVWTKGIEIQIADGQTGDIVVLDGARLTSWDGVTHSKPWSTFYRDDPKNRQKIPGWRSPDDPEKPGGELNTIEVISRGGSINVLVNGKKVFTGTGAYPYWGKVYLQSNGAEIFFKKLEIKPIE